MVNTPTIGSLVLKGKMKIDNMEFHHIEGGFGKGKKAMLAKDIAKIHSREPFKINELINNSRKRFRDNIDILDLKGTKYEILLKDNGMYTQNAVNRSANIYLLSERGYSKLLKILEDDFAWEQYEKLVDGYFNMRKAIKDTANKLEKLSSINNAARTILPVLEKAGMKPEFQVYMLKQLYEKAGVDIPAERHLSDQLFDLTAIAKMLGVYSAKGNPHSQAIGTIISKINLDDNEVELTSFERNGHVGTSYQYRESVIDKVRKWLLINGHPIYIQGKGKSYRIDYKIDKEGAIL